MEISEKVLGQEHHDTLQALGNLAATLSALGRAAEAEPLERRRLEISEKVSVRQISMLIDTIKKEPRWFVSHWWGESVLHFVQCVCAHAKHRTRDGDEPGYWVCAYANRQHELGAEISDNPLESSVFKAMDIARGILLILDKKATAFTRLWCCFEQGAKAEWEKDYLCKICKTHNLHVLQFFICLQTFETMVDRGRRADGRGWADICLQAAVGRVGGQSAAGPGRTPLAEASGGGWGSRRLITLNWVQVCTNC